MSLAFPKPKDAKRRPVEAVRTMPDGREICNLDTKEGAAMYVGRIKNMVLRQSFRCCLEAYAPMCPGSLSINHATFEHETPRSAGRQDDRIELPSGRWINGAAHRGCNHWKGSRYIDYNRGFQK